MSEQPNTETQIWPAPAKLNLFLHVTGQQLDGYPDLQSLFQLLAWGDELKFGINNSGVIDRIAEIEGVPRAKDLCLRAAALLKAQCGVRQGVNIELLKRIPLGAGLGGGSSDAATVLLALNQLWSCGLSRFELAGLGLQLGADVPLFVHGHSALAEGRGEKLRAVNLGRRFYVLVFPGIQISTAEVFRHPNLKRDSQIVDLEHVALECGRNDCETVAFELFPERKKIMQDLHPWGEPRMGGSGSTSLLTLEDKKSAINATTELKCRYNVRAVGGLDRSAVLDKLPESAID